MLISVAEAARRLEVTPRRVVALINQGRLEAVKIGRTWVLEDAALERVKVRVAGWPSGRKRKDNGSDDS